MVKKKTIKTKSKIKKSSKKKVKKKPTKKVVKKKKPVKRKTPKPTKIKHKKKSKKPTEVHYHSTKEIKVEKALIENFIGLQKVMVNLSSRFDELSNQISKLLNLFEVSAKAMAKKEFAREKDPEFKKILDKLDNVTQQAGLIGKGLALIHEVSSEEPSHFEPQPSQMIAPRPKPLARPMGSRPMPQQTGMMPSIQKPETPTPKRPTKIPKISEGTKTMEMDEKPEL